MSDWTALGKMWASMPARFASMHELARIVDTQGDFWRMDVNADEIGRVQEYLSGPRDPSWRARAKGKDLHLEPEARGRKRKR